jgi:hypothetical protein
MGPSGLCGGLAHLVVVDCFVSFVFCVFCFVLPTVLALFPDCSPLLNEKRAMHILKKAVLALPHEPFVPYRSACSITGVSRSFSRLSPRHELAAVGIDDSRAPSFWIGMRR